MVADQALHQNQDLEVRVLLPELVAQRLDLGGARHLGVQDGYVGESVAGRLPQGLGVPGLGHDLEARLLLQQGGRGGPPQCSTLYKHYSNQFSPICRRNPGRRSPDPIRGRQLR